MSNRIPPRKVIILGKPRPRLVRNRGTGKILMCMYRDCESPGSDDIRIETLLEEPMWPGQKLIKVFCSQAHRELYIFDNVLRSKGAQR